MLISFKLIKIIVLEKPSIENLFRNFNGVEILFHITDQLVVESSFINSLFEIVLDFSIGRNNSKKILESIEEK